MMTIILEFCIGLALLTTFIYGDHHDHLVEKLNQMARHKTLINGELRPIENGFIKRGIHSSIFKGERKWDNLKVAMKFTQKIHKNESDREFEMYTYLNAIDSPEVEKFGFAAVHYYKEWNKEYMVMALSRFEEDLIDALNKGCFNYSSKQGAVNSLILFRNFVRQSKYMHSFGVRHNDIEPENIMLRGFQSFLIDFNLSSKMSEQNDVGTFLYTSRRCHRMYEDKKGHLRNALDDYESFLYTMCKLSKVQLKWFKFSFDDMEPEEAFKLCGQMKNNTTDTIEHIKATIKSEPLLKVFLAFAGEVFNDHNVFPNYDHMDELITNEIHRVLNPPGLLAEKPVAPLFSWLNYLDRNAGIEFLHKYSKCLRAKNIPDPPADLNSINYGNIEYDYFSKSREGLERRIPDQFLSRLVKVFTMCDINTKHH